MKRAIQQHFEIWSAAPSKPLLVLGARQIGKTYSIREFAAQRYKKCHEINLQSRTSAHAAFSGDLDPQYILRELELTLGQTISRAGDELIFLDEIQDCPPALTALKYFCEAAPTIPVIAAGSLLGLHLSPASFPVGKVDILHMYPMSFGEVIQTHSNKLLVDAFAGALKDPRTLSPVAHQGLWREYKNYLCTGGLPEAVKVWNELGGNGSLKSLQGARHKIDTLCISYLADFAKHAGKTNAMHIERVWQSSAVQLASYQDESTLRFRFKDIIPGKSAYRDLVGPLSWLTKANLLLRVPIATRGLSPLATYTKDNIFKAYLFDVGVLASMVKLAVNEIQQFDFGSYKGYLAENFVATELISSNRDPSAPWQPYAWTEGHAEIEFLFSSSHGLIPIEVKAGGRIRSQSLKSYITRYQPKTSVILSSRMPEITHANETRRINIPIYLASYLHSLN